MIPRRTRPRLVTRELRIIARRDRSLLVRTEAGAEIDLPLAEITEKPADRFGWTDITMPDWLARDRDLK